MANFYINVAIIAREHSCKIGRFYYIQTPAAPVRYVTTQKNTLKYKMYRPVPGRLSNSPVIFKSLQSYDVSFICDHSITCTSTKSIGCRINMYDYLH